MDKPDFDVGIIGGGPAGASMGAYLAKAGIDCVIFERELFPRPHVGESLVPSSTRVFKELGFMDKLHEAGFPKKFGAAWTTAKSGQPAVDMAIDDVSPDCHAQIRFEEREQAGVDKNYTFHVDRGKFDLLLLQHANELGAKVHEGVRIQHVDFDGDMPAVKFKLGRRELSTRCRMVVDASGRHTVLGNQLKLKVRDPVFDQYAVHSWFDGYDRKRWAQSDNQLDFIFIHFLPLENTWMWQIPITDSVTSIGVVTQKKNFAKTRELREDFFWNTVQSRPDIYEALKASRQARPFHEEGDYSYAMKQICGDNFVMVGDAARFVDPIFSTGVSIALNCSRFASADILGAFEAGNFKKSAFDTYEKTIRRGTKNWYDFITVYYRLNILFTYFVNNPQYRYDVLKLLQGDVYDDESPPVLNEMRNIVSKIERNPNHMWHGLLNDLTHKTFQPLP